MEQSVYDQYELVVGLEVHMQLKTASKAYASDANLFGALPNTLVSPITLGHPGTLPKVNTELMNLFLQEMSECYKGEKIVIVMDGAGWHKSKKLIVPANIIIVHLPPYSPELNPVERLWLHIKSNTIRNKIYDSLDDLENVICDFINGITQATAAQICSVNWFN
jgi:hypothetical protein